MSIKSLRIKVNGIKPLLLNNPQTVDPFNKYSKAMKSITAKRTGKTEDDLLELGNIEVESKLYFDDELGVYVPSRWLTEAICTAAFGTVKIGRDKMRGGIFSTEDKVQLTYKGSNKVKTKADIVKNSDFRIRMGLPQGKVRICKDFPIFHGWSFETSVEYDDSIIDEASLRRVVEHTSKYVGYGDFRPTFGRALAEVTA